MTDIFALVHKTDQLDNEFSGAEVLLPVQFHDGRSDATTVEPLRRPMVAILLDAIRCVQTKFDARQPARRQDCADARSWIFSDDDRAVFSFKAVCDALDIDANAIRKYLVRSGKRKGLAVRSLGGLSGVPRYRCRSGFRDKGGEIQHLQSTHGYTLDHR